MLAKNNLQNASWTNRCISANKIRNIKNKEAGQNQKPGSTTLKHKAQKGERHSWKVDRVPSPHTERITGVAEKRPPRSFCSFSHHGNPVGGKNTGDNSGTEEVSSWLQQVSVLEESALWAAEDKPFLSIVLTAMPRIRRFKNWIPPGVGKGTGKWEPSSTTGAGRI